MTLLACWLIGVPVVWVVIGFLCFDDRDAGSRRERTRPRSGTPFVAERLRRLLHH